MTVKIQSVHFDADKKLLAFVEERVDKLTHFYDGIIKSEVILKLDKGDAAENKIAEIISGSLIGSDIELTIWRDKKEIKLTVTLSEAPSQ